MLSAQCTFLACAYCFKRNVIHTVTLYFKLTKASDMNLTCMQTKRARIYPNVSPARAKTPGVKPQRWNTLVEVYIHHSQGEPQLIKIKDTHILPALKNRRYTLPSITRASSATPVWRSVYIKPACSWGMTLIRWTEHRNMCHFSTNEYYIY